MGNTAKTLREEMEKLEAVAQCPECNGTWFEIVITQDGKMISHYRCRCGNEIPATKAN